MEYTTEQKKQLQINYNRNKLFYHSSTKHIESLLHLEDYNRPKLFILPNSNESDSLLHLEDYNRQNCLFYQILMNQNHHLNCMSFHLQLKQAPPFSHLNKLFVFRQYTNYESYCV